MDVVDSPAVDALSVAGAVERAGLEVLADAAGAGADAEGVLTQVCETLVAHSHLVAATIVCSSREGEVVAHGTYPSRFGPFVLVQFAQREGPCYDCWRRGSTVVERELTDQAPARWPLWWPSARDLVPVDAAVRSMPLIVGTRLAGSVGLIARHPAMGASEARSARQIAQLAAALVLTERSRAHAEGLAGQLEHALRSRVRIEQAKGAVARDLRIDVESAFELLRRRARSERRRLHDVAGEVVQQLARQPRTETAGPPPAPEGTGDDEPALQIQRTVEGVRLSGTADLASSRSLADALAELSGDELTVDLTELEFLDGQCGRTLLAAAARLGRGQRLLLRRPRPGVARVLELLGAAQDPRVRVVQGDA